MKQLTIVGGGFAGVWAALAAARQRERLGPGASALAITLVSRDPWLTIRPRLYEASLEDVRVPLDAVLGPAGVERVEADVTGIDSAARTVATGHGGRAGAMRYDRLVLAAGSRVSRPPIRGMEHAFGVDSFAEASALHAHVDSLAARPEIAGAGRFTAVVVGAGFTGIEVATTLIARLRAVAAGAGAGAEPNVVVVERASVPAPDMGPSARRHIERALATLGITVRTGRTVTAVGTNGVELDGAEWIPAATVIWTGGFRASGLTALLPVERDASGRLPVDESLRVRGVPAVYAAGDVAAATVDGSHVAPMSCQYAIPMGEVAGGNAALDLLGAALEPFVPPPYVTCLDLGEAGALFTTGWERDVRLTGHWASVMKQTINRRLIYPPVRLERDAGAPVSGAARGRGDVALPARSAA